MMNFHTTFIHIILAWYCLLRYCEAAAAVDASNPVEAQQDPVLDNIMPTLSHTRNTTLLSSIGTELQEPVS